MSFKIIEGRCHSGNIHYELAWPAHALPITVRECSCSFCQKHGAVYTSHPESKLAVYVEDEHQVNRYRFGHETADFVLCARCGILLFAICALNDKDYAVINANNFEHLDKNELIYTTTNFDLESIDVRLERRQKNWTPDVSFLGLS